MTVNDPVPSVTIGYDNNQGVNYLFAQDLSYTDPNAFKESLVGVKLIYELNTPQILDVTEYFTDENYRFLEVEGGGTITFKQSGDYRIAIPSVAEYDVKVGD